MATGGVRSQLAPWQGGASSTPAVAPSTPGGVRSMLAFWMRGASSTAQSQTTDTRAAHYPQYDDILRLQQFEEDAIVLALIRVVLS